VFFAKEGEMFGQYQDTIQVRLKGEEKMYYVLKSDFDEVGKATKAEATPEVEAPTQANSKLEPHKAKAVEAGQKSGTTYAYNLVGQYHVMKNGGKKPPNLTLNETAKMDEWRRQAKAKGYTTEEEETEFATAKKQTLEKVFQKGTGQKIVWQ
jgi:hypothetical protein